MYNIFKACDIRGICNGKELTEDIAYKIGKGVVKLLDIDSPKVVVGGDVRLSTDILKNNLINGIIENNGYVYDIGVVPTPAFNFANNFLDSDCGVMVTASHNSKEYNGFKIVLNKLPISEEELNKLKEIISNDDEVKKDNGKIEKKNIIPEYKKYIIETFNRNFRKCIQTNFENISSKKYFKIVIDAGNGCYSKISPEVFRNIGFNVEELNCSMDGSFPNRSPNPAIASNLTELCKVVKKEKANLGLAFDGDGDRVVFVDDEGKVVPTDKSIVIFLRHILKDKQNQKVIYDIKCSSIVEEEIKKSGSIPVMEKSGHTYIRHRLIKENAIFGGEISGHFFFSELKGDDGLYAGLVYSNIIMLSSGKLSDILKTISSYFTTSDIRIPYDLEKADKLIQELPPRFTGYEIDTLDGVKIKYNDGWALIRKSVTESLLTIRFEGYTMEALKNIIKSFTDEVPELKNLLLDKNIDIK